MTERIQGEDVIVENTTEDVVIEEAHDVIVKGDAVGGRLVVESAEDVIVEGGDLSVEDAQDVLVDGTVEGDVDVGSAEFVENDG
jgi:hypothetical protein